MMTVYLEAHGIPHLLCRRFQGGSTPPPLFQAPDSPQLTTAQPRTWPGFLEEQFRLSGVCSVLWCTDHTLQLQTAGIDCHWMVPRFPGGAVSADRAGPLRPEDIPASAADFHISNIIEELLARPAIREAAARVAAATGRDAADCLRTAMWLHSSSVNLRCPLQVGRHLPAHRTDMLGVLGLDGALTRMLYSACRPAMQILCAEETGSGAS